MIQLWRQETDSRDLERPRFFIRIFVGAREWETTVAWYESLLNVKRDMVMPYPQKNLVLAAVGGFLIIAGEDEALEPFRETVGTVLVPDIAGYIDKFRAEGVEFVQEPFTAPVGEGITVRHPDGTVIEYVHHRPSPYEIP